MKKIIITVLILIVLVFAWTKLFNKNEGVVAKDDYKNIEYIVDGERVKLEGEFAYFGNEVWHDLDEDGTEDVVFLITQNSGGSGTFYYVVGALNTGDGFVGSEAVFLGDRIAPQTTEIDEGQTATGTYRQNVIVVNYADRNPGEPFSTQPSVGKSIWLKLDPATMQFGEVAQNFEGESAN